MHGLEKVNPDNRENSTLFSQMIADRSRPIAAKMPMLVDNTPMTPVDMSIEEALGQIEEQLTGALCTMRSSRSRRLLTNHAFPFNIVDAVEARGNVRSASGFLRDSDHCSVGYTPAAYLRAGSSSI